VIYAVEKMRNIFENTSATPLKTHYIFFTFLHFSIRRPHDTKLYPLAKMLY